MGPAAVVAGISMSAAQNKDVRFLVFGPAAELQPLVDKRKLTDVCVVRDVADYRIAFLGAALCNVAAVGLLRLAGPISDAHALWVEPAAETTT